MTRQSHALTCVSAAFTSKKKNEKTRKQAARDEVRSLLWSRRDVRTESRRCIRAGGALTLLPHLYFHPLRQRPLFSELPSKSRAMARAKSRERGNTRGEAGREERKRETRNRCRETGPARKTNRRFREEELRARLESRRETIGKLYYIPSVCSARILSNTI